MKITQKQKVTSIVVIVALILGSVGGYYIYTNLSSGEVQATIDLASLYQDEIVTVGDITVGISESGTASLVYEVLDLDSGYEITETIAEVGLYVEEGDVIATIDLENSDIEDTDESDAVKEAEDALTQTTIEVESALVQAKNTYDASVAAGQNAQTVYDLAIDDIYDTEEDYEDDIEDLEDEIAELKSQLTNGLDDDYSNTLALAANDVTIAEAALEAKVEEITTLTATIAAMDATTEVDVLNEMEDELTNLQYDKSDLVAALADAEDDYQDAYDTAYAEASSEYTQKKSELTTLEKNLASYQAGMDSMIVAAESTYNTTITTYSNAYALYTLTVESLEEELEAAEETLENAEADYEESLEEDEDSNIVIDEDGNLLAPCTGYVTTVVEPTSVTIEGNTISTGLSITISDGDYAEISVSVSQDDIGDISLGMDTIVVFDSYEDMPIMTTVTSFSLTPSSEISTSVNYDVTVLCEIPQDEGMTIFSSMTATVTFVEHQCTDVLLVSTNYIVYEDAQQYVYVEQADGTVELVEIETGFSDGFDVEIISGVEEGDIIINESAVSGIEN